MFRYGRQEQAASTIIYRLERNTAGNGVLRDSEGLSGGIFRNRRDAIRYALFQAERPGAVFVAEDLFDIETLR